MEIRRTVAITLNTDEYEALEKAQYLIENIAQKLSAYSADSVVCADNGDRTEYSERELWEIASAIESIKDIRFMYSPAWNIEEIE